MVYTTHELLGSVTTSSVVGAAVFCDSLIDKWLEVSGASAGSFDVELSTSDSGDDWTVPDSLTGLDGTLFWYEIPQPAKRIRINPTGLTATRIRLRGRPG